MPHIDLYAAHGLDPRADPPTLAARLAEQLSGTEDPVQRRRIEIARAILGDPQKRSVYDRHLADPQAPPITEAVLAQIAGVQLPTTSTASRPTLTDFLGSFADTKVRSLAGVVAALAAVLVVVIVAVVATSGGGDDATDSAGSPRGNDISRSASPSGASAGGESRADLEADRGSAWDLSRARWGRNSSDTPEVTLHLNQAFDLPDPLPALVTSSGSERAIGPQQDHTVIVWASDRYVHTYYLAQYDHDGKLLSTKSLSYSDTATLQRSDLAVEPSSGYFQIEAEDGVEIPATANGNEPNMNYAISIQPDPYDKKLFWVLLRGGSKLYKGDLRWSQSYLDRVAPK